MAAFTSRSPTCSVCNHSAPRPLLICFVCSEGTDPNGTIDLTIYCGTNCRDSDKTHHKLCKAKNERKCLYRAGDLLQAVFYDWRETAFDIEVESTWKESQIWKDPDQAEIVCFRWGEAQPNATFFPFPNEMFESLRDKQMMLAYSSCTDVMTNLLELNKRALKGLGTASHELKLEMDPERLTVYRWIGNMQDLDYHKHSVLHVVLHGGEEYVLDIAGAQYGQFRAVIPYAAFLEDCALEEVSREELGHAAAHLARPEATEEEIGVREASAVPQLRFKAAIDDWEASRSQTIHQLLSGNKQDYEEGKDALLSKVHAALRKAVDDMKSR